jgi:poly(3-hydroxybutyrate) depolymerase
MTSRAFLRVVVVSAMFIPGCAAIDSTGDRADAARDAAPLSRCRIGATEASCDHRMLRVSDSLVNRDVAYQVPLGTPPANGWPVVVFFQGSFVPGVDAFSGSVFSPFGVFDLVRTIKALLDDGYAVIAPNAAVDGTTFWQTNIPPFATSWAGSLDDHLVLNLLTAIESGAFGPIDASRLYAMGISSGGFMTSRMAVSYPGRFRALADHSGSYATCSAICFVPTPLPADHPPTLLLHGDLDAIVPSVAVLPYVDALRDEGHEVQLVTDPLAGHRWLRAAAQVIPAWFDAHR